MLYPKVMDVRKGNKIYNLMIFISAAVYIICKIVNVLCTKDFNWSLIVLLGIIYGWTTVIYALRKHTNISAHVLLHTILLIALTYGLDKYVFDFQGWSIKYALPIILIVANSIMLVLTIVAMKKYMSYAFSHLMILIFSFLPLIAYRMNYSCIFPLVMVVLGIAVISFLLTFIFCRRFLIETLHKTLHL